MQGPSKDDKRKLAQQALIFALLGWPAAVMAVVIGLLISGTAHASIADWLKMLAQVGLIGSLAALALWALYRLIRPVRKL
jgi:spore maturation protein SpmB